MKMARFWIAAGAILSLAGLALVVGQAYAADKGEIAKIVALIKKGDSAGAKKLAEAYAKKSPDLDELMHGFKPAKKGGLMEPGIEQTLIKIGRDAPTAAQMAKSAGEFTDMGYYTAAIGLITEAAAPEKSSGKKTRKDWIEWSKAMSEQGVKLADAAKAKGAGNVKDAASKINTACNSCHSVFR